MNGKAGDINISIYLINWPVYIFGFFKKLLILTSKKREGESEMGMGRVAHWFTW